MKNNRTYHLINIFYRAGKRILGRVRGTLAWRSVPMRTFGAVLIVTCLCPCSTLRAAILLDRVVAVVNNEVITWSELYGVMQSEASEELKALPDEERMRVFKSNEAVFLEKLIDMKLQIQEAKRLGLQVRDEEVTEAIEKIKRKYELTDGMLRESLQREGLTFDEYKKRLADQILLSQFVAQQIRNKIIVPEESVTSALQAQGRAGGEEEFRLRQIFFKKPADEGARQELEEKARRIVKRLQGGEDFTALSWEFSDDPASKIGSDLGFVKKSHLAKEFVDVLTHMNVGDVSMPFWTDRGLHIVKLEERVATKTSEEQRSSIRARLEEEAFAEKYRSYMKGLRERARIEVRL